MSVTEEKSSIWTEVCELVIEDSPTPERSRDLLNDAYLERFDDNEVVLSFSSAIRKGGFDRSLIELFKDALYGVTGGEVEISTIVNREAPRNTAPKPAVQQMSAPQVQPMPQRQVATTQYAPQPLPQVNMRPSEAPVEKKNPFAPATSEESHVMSFTFENFVVGDSNKMAFSAAQNTAEKPGQTYNPLFIYGSSGLGKTHLLLAIKNYVDSNYPYMKTLFCQAKNIVDDIVSITRDFRNDGRNLWESFAEKYYDVDIIMIDDIQFLEGKQESIEQVFQIFNVLDGKGKQIVISSDRHPTQIDMDERMKSRFNKGLTVSIEPPTFETKVAIISRFAERKFPDMMLGEDTADYIARISNSNIRDIEGAINLLGYQHYLLGKEITLDAAQEILLNFFPEKNMKSVDMNHILKEVARRYSISIDQLLGTSRAKKILRPRQIAMYCSRMMTENSFPEIGKKFGKDHTTVMHSVEVIEQEIASKPEFKNEITLLMDKIRERA